MSKGAAETIARQGSCIAFLQDQLADATAQNEALIATREEEQATAQWEEHELWAHLVELNTQAASDAWGREEALRVARKLMGIVKRGYMVDSEVAAVEEELKRAEK